MLPSLPRVSRRASTMLSYALSLITLPILVVITILLPRILRLYVQVVYTPEMAASPNLMERIPVTLWIVIYVGVAIAYLADGAMLVLLGRVRHEQVFTDRSVACLRILSWCCIGEAVCFFYVGFYFRFSFAVSFAAFFIGAALRVVKNVVEEATAIKAENDFTI
ncbi:MAG: DUF2975 domain-containing protein [Clostridia bacterium]|nr:DUF2975 domain-containing protein [Clostridia bacterium]